MRPLQTMIIPPWTALQKISRCRIIKYKVNQGLWIANFVKKSEMKTFGSLLTTFDHFWTTFWVPGSSTTVPIQFVETRYTLGSKIWNTRKVWLGNSIVYHEPIFWRNFVRSFHIPSSYIRLSCWGTLLKWLKCQCNCCKFWGPLVNPIKL